VGGGEFVYGRETRVMSGRDDVPYTYVAVFGTADDFPALEAESADGFGVSAKDGTALVTFVFVPNS